MTNISDALVPWDALGATADVFWGFSEQDLTVSGLVQYWQSRYQMFGVRKDILEVKFPDNEKLKTDCFSFSSRIELIFRSITPVEDAGKAAATIEDKFTSKRLLEIICRDTQISIRSFLENYKTEHPGANGNRLLCFIETVLLVVYSNQTSNGVANAARAAIRACPSNNAATRIFQVAKNMIEVNAQEVITGIRSLDTIISTAGKAEKAVNCIAKAAAASVSLTLGSHVAAVNAPDVCPKSPETRPPERIIPMKDFWTMLCRVAFRRYETSACLSTSAIESFIIHLQDGGDEGGTAPLILKEDYDDSPFELGPRSTIRREHSSGDVVLEWGDGFKAIISEADRMMEAEARGLFDEETSLSMLQATLHDLIIDSTDAITSIQYLDGLEAHDHSDRPSWENSKVEVCRRFLSSFMPSGLWDDCTARHALRDKRRPGLHFDFYLQTTLKSICASLIQRRQAKLQWRWSAHNSCTFEGDMLIANGYYLDTIVLVDKGIYVAERVTHGTSVVQWNIWKTAPWRPFDPRVSLMALEDELDRLNGKLLKLQQSSRWHRNLISSKLVGLPLVAFAGAVAAIGSIVAAAGPGQLGLAVLGLTAAVAAFLLSFLDYAIGQQLKQTATKIADATQARTRYEGAQMCKRSHCFGLVSCCSIQ